MHPDWGFPQCGHFTQQCRQWGKSGGRCTASGFLLLVCNIVTPHFIFHIYFPLRCFGRRWYFTDALVPLPMSLVLPHVVRQPGSLQQHLEMNLRASALGTWSNLMLGICMYSIRGLNSEVVYEPFPGEQEISTRRSHQRMQVSLSELFLLNFCFCETWDTSELSYICGPVFRYDF